MSRSKKKLRCYAYLSVFGDDRYVEQRENKQLKVIQEYAKANNIEIVGIYHKDVFSQADVNRHFMTMVQKVKDKKADGVIVTRMRVICTSREDAYIKICRMNCAGGHMITVDEGDLKLDLKSFAK